MSASALKEKYLHYTPAVSSNASVPTKGQLKEFPGTSSTASVSTKAQLTENPQQYSVQDQNNTEDFSDILVPLEPLDINDITFSAEEIPANIEYELQTDGNLVKITKK